MYLKNNAKYILINRSFIKICFYFREDRDYCGAIQDNKFLTLQKIFSFSDKKNKPCPIDCFSIGAGITVRKNLEEAKVVEARIFVEQK